MPEPCKIHWCDALATREGYCAVHYVTPNYDPRVHYERVIDGTVGMARAKSYRPRLRREPDPVDERPLIIESEK